MANPSRMRHGFWRFWWRSLDMGVARLGSFSQRDRIVGWGVLGAIMFGPLASGVFAVVFGLIAVLIPSAVITVLILMAVCMSGAYGQLQASQAVVAARVDETLYYKAILDGQTDQATKQKHQADLIDEGWIIADAIVANMDAQVSEFVLRVQDWRDRCRAYLTEHAYNGVTEAAAWYRAFDHAPNTSVQRKGGHYGGHLGTLAAQVEHAAEWMSRLHIPERNYFDYRTMAELADKRDEELDKG